MTPSLKGGEKWQVMIKNVDDWGGMEETEKSLTSFMDVLKHELWNLHTTFIMQKCFNDWQSKIAERLVTKEKLIFWLIFFQLVKDSYVFDLNTILNKTPRKRKHKLMNIIDKQLLFPHQYVCSATTHWFGKIIMLFIHDGKPMRNYWNQSITQGKCCTGTGYNNEGVIDFLSH